MYRWLKPKHSRDDIEATAVFGRNGLFGKGTVVLDLDWFFVPLV